MADLKAKVLEFSEIARLCPENLQAVCFELLLRNYLDMIQPTKPTRSEEKVDPPHNACESKPDNAVAKGQEDLAEADLHVKVRHFMKKHGVSLEQLNNLYYKEGEVILPLYEDLKTTRLSESQVRITLLLALRQAILTGDFQAQVADVRTECTERKCYDQNNFSNNFNNNAALFDFAKYSKSLTSLRLSENGREELAEVIKELQ